MLGIIVATTLITLVLNLILKKVQLPTIIGYILTGTDVKRISTDISNAQIINLLDRI